MMKSASLITAFLASQTTLLAALVQAAEPVTQPPQPTQPVTESKDAPQKDTITSGRLSDTEERRQASAG